MLLVSLCPQFPPVANHVERPVSSPVEFWVAGTSASHPLTSYSQNAYKLAFQNQIKLCKE